MKATVIENQAPSARAVCYAADHEGQDDIKTIRFHWLKGEKTCPGCGISTESSAQDYCTKCFVFSQEEIVEAKDALPGNWGRARGQLKLKCGGLVFATDASISVRSRDVSFKTWLAKGNDAKLPLLMRAVTKLCVAVVRVFFTKEMLRSLRGPGAGVRADDRGKNEYQDKKHVPPCVISESRDINEATAVSTGHRPCQHHTGRPSRRPSLRRTYTAFF